MVITPYLSVLFSILAQTQIDDPNRFNQYLLLAYAVMWIVASAYLLNLANKQRNLRQEIELMQRLLEEDEAESAS
jgi:CcmD family protein